MGGTARRRASAGAGSLIRIPSARRDFAPAAGCLAKGGFGDTLAPVPSLDKQLDEFLRSQPALHRGVYVAAGAVVLGAVTIGEFSSIWPNAVLRGDINRIVLGHHTNVQDNSVLHVADQQTCTLGNYVTAGHGVILHACTVGDEVLVGMGSVVLDGAVIGEQSIIGARALVPQGMRIPPGSLVMGVPGRLVRELSPQERAGIKGLAEKYVELAAYYLKHRINVSPVLTSA